MGGGTGIISNYPDKAWNYPIPNSVMETVLRAVYNQLVIE